jgi:hypothetical protein
MSNKTISITVQYVGADDFVEDVHGDPVFKVVKLKALDKFELEKSAADMYVLQYGGTDVSDTAHVSSLGLPSFTLVLMRKKEPEKG